MRFLFITIFIFCFFVKSQEIPKPADPKPITWDLQMENFYPPSFIESADPNWPWPMGLPPYGENLNKCFCNCYEQME